MTYRGKLIELLLSSIILIACSRFRVNNIIKYAIQSNIYDQHVISSTHLPVGSSLSRRQSTSISWPQTQALRRNCQWRLYQSDASTQGENKIGIEDLGLDPEEYSEDDLKFIIEIGKSYGLVCCLSLEL
jgi:hypothetical protein